MDCGRGDDEDQQVERELTEKARPKPGGCCSTKKGVDAEKPSSCQSGNCDCATSASSSNSSATTVISPANDEEVRGIVPPKRVKDVRGVGKRPICYKCNEKLANVNLKDQIICSSCFTFLFVAKVKSCLRLRCQLGKAVRLLVAVSGGAASSCLARILHIASDPHQPRRLFFGFDLVYVDESAVALGTQEENETFNQQAVQLYEQYAVKLIRVPLEEVMSLCTDQESPAQQPNTSSASTTPSSSSFSSSSSASPSSVVTIVQHPTAASNRAALHSLFASLTDPSDKADLLSLLRTRLLAHIARLYGYAEVVLGDSATRTAVDVFADTAKGRGAHVPLQVLFRETKFQVQFLYPLREQINSPIALFNHFSQITPVYEPTFTSCKKYATPTSAGINKLTHDFICMLDAKFNNSVNNITGTVQKLIVPPEYEQSSRDDASLLGPTSHCSVCGRVRVKAEDEADRAAAMKHARIANLPSANEEQNLKQLAQISACYGCAALLREIKQPSLLPAFIRAGVPADHRGTHHPYAKPFNASIANASKPMLSHEERAKLNAAKKEEQRRREEAEAALADLASPQELHKQSRDDMRASFAEFILADE